MAVLVTVGAGRIGSHAAPHLVKRDKEVTVRILTLDGIRECGQANVCVELALPSLKSECSL
jgi:nucleoside-diphosphate-sugar epimerase